MSQRSEELDLRRQLFKKTSKTLKTSKKPQKRRKFPAPLKFTPNRLMRSAARSTTPLLLALLSVLLLCGGVSQAAPASKTKGKPKAAKPTASSMVDGEGGMPSPIKPVKQVPPEEMASRFFKEALAPFGEWIELGEYGQCWRPGAVDERWAPYTVGSWAYSRYGWTWVSAEDFAD